MLNRHKTTYNTGVIIGRFQVAELHDQHKELIQTVLNECENVILLLGLSVIPNTKTNPLDFVQRKKMIQESFPDLDIGYIKDIKDDNRWSKKVDQEVKNRTPRNHSVALFGSRDSFIAHYDGKYQTVELEATRFISGSEQREAISKRVKTSYDYRAGIISAAHCRYPTSFHTVDIIVHDVDKNQFLLGRKPFEKDLK